MAKTLVRNVSVSAYTFPLPYKGTLRPGFAGVVDDAPQTAASVLGDTTGVLDLEEVPDASTTTIPKASLTTAELADDAVTAAKAAVFVSAPIVGNGAAQNTPHGLGVAPSLVMVSLVGSPAAYAQAVVTPGAHTATNVVATVTTGWSYQVLAWA